MANSTPNLTIPHIASNQNQKEVTANTAFDLLDGAMNGATSIDIGGSGNVTPSSTTLLQNFSFTLTGALLADISLLVPTNKKFYRFHHNALHPSIGDYTVTVKVSGQTGVVLYPGDRKLLYCNGTDIVACDLMRLPPFTVAGLAAYSDPVLGLVAIATDGQKVTDNPSLAGTGCPVYYTPSGPSGAGWYRFSDDTLVHT